MRPEVPIPCPDCGKNPCTCASSPTLRPVWFPEHCPVCGANTKPVLIGWNDTRGICPVNPKHVTPMDWGMDPTECWCGPEETRHTRPRCLVHFEPEPPVETPHIDPCPTTCFRALPWEEPESEPVCWCCGTGPEAPDSTYCCPRCVGHGASRGTPHAE